MRIMQGRRANFRLDFNFNERIRANFLTTETMLFIELPAFFKFVATNVFVVFNVLK